MKGHYVRNEMIVCTQLNQSIPRPILRGITQIVTTPRSSHQEVH